VPLWSGVRYELHASGYVAAVGGATREYYREVLEDATNILSDAGAAHLVIGGLATRALLDMPLDLAEDIDVLVRAADADRLLDRFSAEGYATHRQDPRWIYKAAKPDVTVDLIFRAGEVIRLDELHLARSTKTGLEGSILPVPAPEDLIVMKVVFDADDRQGRWYGAISLLQHLAIDWTYLAERGATYAPRRVLSLLLYASDLGISVPDEAIARLAPLAISPVEGAREQ
jgi:hypothetical protein